jgi:acyl-CoA synthetase (AMP-forming)/AMP-acid ligase II
VRNEEAGRAADGLPRTIPQALDLAADRYQNDDALVDGATRLSFRQLAARVEQVARALVASGIEPGDRVSLWAPNSSEWVIVSFAIYAVGAVLVPVNTRYRGEEAGHVLRTSRSRLLFTVTDMLGSDLVAFLDEVPGLEALEEIVILEGPTRPGCTPIAEFTARGTDAQEPEVARRRESLLESDASDIVFTSGTTGHPKGAVLGHGASIRTYLAWSELVGLRRGDRYLVVYPFFHTAGLKSGLLACILRGATIIPHAVFDVVPVMEVVASERITMLPGPPTVFQSILNHPDFASFDLSSLRLSVTGAAIVPVEVIRRMREELRFETVVTGYGLTETTGTVSMCRHDDAPDVIANTVGRPLPGVSIRVVDESGEAVPMGHPGEILVRGFNVMKEYFEDPTATKEAIDEDGWLRTGDIGILGQDGNLRITDRKKDMFIVGGFNAYPAEIEGILIGHPEVGQVAVIGTADERLGEVGVAFVVPRPGRTVDPEDLAAWCRDHMANFKVPRSIHIVDSLPMNPTGKVMKFVLREQLKSRNNQVGNVATADGVRSKPR